MICPLRRDGKWGNDNECIKEDCEWYVYKDEPSKIRMCSIKVIAISLYNIELMYNIKG